MLNSRRVIAFCLSEIPPFAAVGCILKYLLTWSSRCYRWKHIVIIHSKKKNPQPNIGLVSKVPIIFVWEQNTCQSFPVLSACVCLDSVFFLLELMELFDTKYEKHANLAPSFCRLCCRSIPAGKTPHSRRKPRQEESISINYPQMSFCSFTNCPYKSDVRDTAVKETEVT